MEVMMTRDPGQQQLLEEQIDSDQFSFEDELDEVTQEGTPEPQPEQQQPEADITDDEEIPSPDPGIADGEAEGGQDNGPQFDERLLGLAGITADTARQHFKDQSELEAALRWQDSQAMQAGRNYLQRQQQQFIPPQQQPQQPQQPQPRPPVEDEFKLDLDPQEWGEETAGLLNKMHGFYTGKITAAQQRQAQMEAVITGMHQHMVRQQQEQFLDAFDSQCNQLGDDYKEVFGSGTRHTFTPTSKEFQNRSRLNQAMQAIAQGRAVSGLPPIPAEQLFDRALRAEFPETSERAVRKEVGQKLTKRFSQATARPTSRQGSPLTPEQAAARRVKDFYAKKGLNLAPDFEDESDGI